MNLLLLTRPAADETDTSFFLFTTSTSSFSLSSFLSPLFSLFFFLFFFFSSFLSMLRMISCASLPRSFSVTSDKDPITLYSDCSILPKQTDWLRTGVPTVKLFRTRGSTDTEPSPRAKSFGRVGVANELSLVKQRRLSSRMAEDWQLGRSSWRGCLESLEAKNSAIPSPHGLL